MIEKVVTIKSMRGDLDSPNDDFLYRLTKTIPERISAVEHLCAEFMRGLPDAHQRHQAVLGTPLDCCG